MNHLASEAILDTRATSINEPIAYVGGQFLPESAARISILDHGVLYGDGIFETAFARQGRIFKLDAHIERGFRSMQAIALDPPVSREELTRIIIDTVRRNRLHDAYIKWIVARGVNGKPLLDPRGCVSNLIVIVRPYINRVSSERARQGLRLKTVGVRRPSGQVLDPRIKSLNYLNLVMAKIEATAAGADEALLLDAHGRVCEATGCNVFIVAGRTLKTPREDILEGITRETVIELADQAGIPVSIGNVELYDAYTADEMFICSTAGGILRIAELDGRTIGRRAAGPVFRSLSERYQTLIESGRHGTPIYGSQQDRVHTGETA